MRSNPSRKSGWRLPIRLKIEHILVRGALVIIVVKNYEILVPPLVYRCSLLLLLLLWISNALWRTKCLFSRVTSLFSPSFKKFTFSFISACIPRIGKVIFHRRLSVHRRRGPLVLYWGPPGLVHSPVWGGGEIPLPRTGQGCPLPSVQAHFLRSCRRTVMFYFVISFVVLGKKLS